MSTAPMILGFVFAFFLSFVGAAEAGGSAGAHSKRNADGKAESHGGNRPDTFAPNADSAFHIQRTAKKPVIDGNIDEAAWKSAVKLGNFCEISPGENTKPAVDTEAMLMYDSDNLYVAIVCRDAPDRIRASITDRDEICADDHAGIMIDTFGDRQNAYGFFVNPHGIQGDLRQTGQNEDWSYDAVWHSGGRISEEGWTAEISIPFRSIRFPSASTQAWGLHIWRARPRNSREEHSWMPVPREEKFRMRSAGTMMGLEGINRGKNLEVLPYAIGSQSGSVQDPKDPSSTFIEGPRAADAGLGVKYGVTSNFTMDFTYNPDFSQIEADAAQIDVNTTFALLFPERRPFFQEGADIFNTIIAVVYTRSINDPIFAGKMTGKSGRTTLGFLTARDETTPYVTPFEESSQQAIGGRSYSNILRVKRDILEDSFIGAIAADRHSESNGGFNTTAGADFNIRFLQNYRFSGQVQGSYTREPDDTTLSAGSEIIRFGGRKEYDSSFNGEEFAGHAAELSLARYARRLDFRVWYRDYSPGFRAENGFVTANNSRIARFWTGYKIYTDKHRLTEFIQPQAHGGLEYNYDGLLKDEWIVPAIRLNFRRQTGLCLGYLFERRRYAGVLVDGIQWVQCHLTTDFSAILSGGMHVEAGHSLVYEKDNPRLGFKRSLEFWGSLKPASQLRLDLLFRSYHMTELENQSGMDGPAFKGDEIHDMNIGRANLTYQFTKNLFFRVTAQYVDSDGRIEANPLVSYKLNPFTVFFLGSSHTFLQSESEAPGNDPVYRQTDRTYFIKLQYLIRV